MKKLSILALSFLTVYLSGCGVTGGVAVSPVSKYLASGSQGDVINWTIDHMAKTIVAVNQEPTRNYTYSGPYTENSFKIKLVHITSTNDPGLDVNSTTQPFFFLLEIPDAAIIVKPAFSSGNDIHVGVAQGGCSGLDGTYNYVRVGKFSDTNDVYGNYTIASGIADYTGYLYTNSVSGTGTVALGTCTNGSFSAGGSTVQVMPSGMMVIDNGSGNGGVIGMKQSSLTHLSMGGTYTALVFNDNAGTGSVEAYQLTFDATGAGTYAQINQTGAVLDNNFSLTTDCSKKGTIALTSSTNGFITGSVQHQDGACAANGSPETIKFSTNNLAGKKFLFGESRSGVNMYASFLAIQTD